MGTPKKWAQTLIKPRSLVPEPPNTIPCSFHVGWRLQGLGFRADAGPGLECLEEAFFQLLSSLRSTLSKSDTHRVPIGSIVVPFCGLYSGSYKVTPKRNYNGAYGSGLHRRIWT